MSLPLFALDRFSIPTPTYHVASGSDGVQVRMVLEEHFGHYGSAGIEILQCGGLELNSSNFLTDLGQRRVVVKRVSGSGLTLASLERQLALSNLLTQRGVPLLHFLGSSAGGCAVEKNGAFFCVSDFVDGDFFYGRIEELHPTAAAVTNLFSELANIPPHLAVQRTFSPPDEQDLIFYENLQRHWPSWAFVFGTHADAIAAAHPRISKALERTVANRDSWSLGTCHYDLHPHNVVMQKGAVAAFLDIDSIVTGPVQVALGFAVFKLLRQSIAISGRADAREMCRRRELFVSRLWTDREISLRDIANAAEAEVLRRLLLILRLNVEQRSTIWNHVLPIQLKALDEVAALFAA